MTKKDGIFKSRPITIIYLYIDIIYLKIFNSIMIVLHNSNTIYDFF